MTRPLDAINGAWNGPRPPVSVVVLTLDEEINIQACLDSCRWSGDVHVLDSGSADRTADIARRAGAHVHVHPFESFGKQRNWAIDNIPLANEWVFHLDADERFTPEIVREIDETLSRKPAEAGFYAANQMIFMDAWIRHASGYPNYQMRLFHRARVRFTDHGHGQREETTGRIGTLRHPYLHFNFSKGIDEWLARHNRYSTREAALMLEDSRAPLRPGDLFSPDAIARRRALKRLGSRLPFRPTLRRLHALFVMGAILDGPPGRTYAALLEIYQRMIDIKFRVLRAGPHA